MPIIELAARALHAELGLDWPYSYDDGMKAYVRAVLQAIREPSEAMLAAAREVDFLGPGESDSAGEWRAMIDAALEEG